MKFYKDNPPKSIPVVDVTDSEDEFQSSASNDIKVLKLEILKVLVNIHSHVYF